ncbi:MAG: hypothetical protein GY697_17370 [Desulfobacterales bacterium]|nr:hypothetical protein [Desulfobacterales bacterium]
MKKFLLKGPYVFEIRNRRENPYPDTEREFYSVFDALRFLRGVMLDRANMTTLREVLANDFTGHAPAGLSDQEVIEQLARRFASGQICIAVRHDRFPPGTDGGGVGEMTAEQFPWSPPPPPPPPVSEPPPLTGPSVAAAGAQAQALKQAAESGSHFCEA